MLTLNNSTLSGNSTSGSGGGIYNSGGYSNYYYNKICVNCYEFRSFTAGTVTVINSTISDNSAVVGGGIYNAEKSRDYIFGAEGSYSDLAGTLTVSNSLVSGNIAETGREVANKGTATSEGYNLFGYSGSNGVDGVNLSSTDIVPEVSLDRILAPLANNGGPTQTHALVPGSPAINRGDPNLTTPDQRGFFRVGRADIGAFEFQGVSPPEVTLPIFSASDLSEITAALNSRYNPVLTISIQPEPTEPILCIVRSQGGEWQPIDDYHGLPDCK
jgi:hypothetical protein